MKKDNYWFSHDYNAASDPKLIALTAAYGMEGYGRWWRLLEMLRGEGEYKYCLTTRFAYSVLAKELMMTADEAKQFIRDCISEFQLLETDEEYIWSASLVQRMEHLDRKRESYSERGKKSAAVKKVRKSTIVEQDLNTAGPLLQLPPTNKTNEEKKEEENSGPLEGLSDDADVLDNYKNQALADTLHFVYPIVSTGRITEPQLGDWLTAFNRLLACRAEEPKNLQDYRRHFINWFKFRDPAREDPKTFLLGNNKSPTVTATFLKTPLQIEEEQKQQRDEWKTRIAQ